MKRNNLLTRLAAALALTFTPASPADAQTAPITPDTRGSVVTLNPFEVRSDSDVGYQATDTLAGSRMNTALKDTAASISVFTEELIKDLGASGRNEGGAGKDLHCDERYPASARSLSTRFSRAWGAKLADGARKRLRRIRLLRCFLSLL